MATNFSVATVSPASFVGLKPQSFSLSFIGTHLVFPATCPNSFVSSHPVVSAQVALYNSNPSYDLSSFNFQPIVAREMIHCYITDMITHANIDFIFVGVGFVGLSCVYELNKHLDVKVAIIEQSVSPRGGAWLDGPTFGAMMVSGQKAARLALGALGLPNTLDGTYKLGGVHPENLVLASAEDETASA